MNRIGVSDTSRPEIAAISHKNFSPSKLLFGLLMLIVIGVAVEIGSFLLLTLSGPGEGSGVSIDTAIVEIEGDTEETIESGRARMIRLLQSRTALHPFLGYVLDRDSHPAAKNKRSHPEAVEYGFIWGREKIFHQAADDQIIVGIFGGSVANQIANFGASLLQEELPGIDRFAGKEVIVIDFALAGYKQPQQLMTLNYFLALGANLDMVLNIDGFNDVALAEPHNVNNGVNPFYPRNWHIRVETLDPAMRRIQGEIAYLRERQAERTVYFKHSLWRYSRTATLLWKIADQQLASLITDKEMGLLNDRSEGTEKYQARGYQARGPKFEYTSRSEMFHEFAEVWRQSSLQMHHLCAGMGIEYYHFLQPNQYDPGSKPLSSEERRNFFREDHPYRPGVIEGYPLLREVGVELRRQGVEFYDTSRIFTDTEETLYVDDCCHYNWKGLGIFVQHIMKAIKERRSPTQSQ